MGSVNKVILVGNLGRDAELRYTPGGAAVATLNLATTETWNDKEGQRQEKTEWHRVILWGKQAETLNQYLQKGKQIYVEGRLQTRQWDDKDGNKRYTTEVRGDRVVLLSSGSGGGGSAAAAACAARCRTASPPTWRRSCPRTISRSNRASYTRQSRESTKTRRRTKKLFGYVPKNLCASLCPRVFVIDERHFFPSRPYRSSRRTTSSSSGVETSTTSQSSIAVMRCTVPGVTWKRPQRRDLVFHQLAVLLDLEQELARQQHDRLVLLVVVLKAERVALVDVDDLADVAVGLRPVQLVAPRFVDARNL